MFNFKKNIKSEGIKNEEKSDEKNEIKAEEEWVWVNGVKGTDENMCCRGFQYELEKQFDLPDGETPELCVTGFHLCLRLQHVFSYYGFVNNNRFFKVKALVRKSELDNYDYCRDERGLMYPGNRKLTAKSIVFVEEITLDEICEYFGITDWPDDNKKLARKIGIDNAQRCINIVELVSLGYSETFAKLVVEDNNRFEIAKAVGSQDGLSMDMKAWLIFK